MVWVKVGLVVLVIAGLALVVCGIRSGSTQLRMKLIGVGLFLILGSGVVGVLAWVNGPTPGGDNGVPVVTPDGPNPLLSKTPLERLQLEWDSDNDPDWPVAETLAEISAASYFAPVDAQAVFHDQGFTYFMPLVHNSMVGYVVVGEKVAVISFRGTDAGEIADWLTNFDFLRTATTPQGSVHSGFYKAYMAMKPQILKILKDREIEHLWITGHSLGGALALLCAHDLTTVEEMELDGLITFGQPKVTTDECAAFINSHLGGRYVRFVNGEDVVPKCPPGFKECGSLIWFTENGIVRSPPRNNSVYASSFADGVQQRYGEIESLNAVEFQQFQDRLRMQSQQFEFRDWPTIDRNVPPFRPPFGRDVPTYGNGPTVAAYSIVQLEDHAMAVYLTKIRELLRVETPE